MHFGIWSLTLNQVLARDVEVEVYWPEESSRGTINFLWPFGFKVASIFKVIFVYSLDIKLKV